MMIIKLAKGKDIVVTDERARRIQETILNGSEFISIDKVLIKTNNVLAIEDQPTGSISYDTEQLKQPTSQLSESQRLKNLNRIKEMKEQFNLRLSK